MPFRLELADVPSARGCLEIWLTASASSQQPKHEHTIAMTTHNLIGYA
jgi:hypothetical protein